MERAVKDIMDLIKKAQEGEEVVSDVEALVKVLVDFNVISPVAVAMGKVRSEAK